jgi:hydrogenase maturation protein HypF
MSQFIGDLKNLATYDFFSEAIDRFSKLFRFKPEYIACDLHPDYLSGQYAEALEKELKIPLFRIQHHHAHIASCMAEHGIDEKVIGISLDGTGFGSDGNIWGGEFMIADLKDFSRFTHFDNIALPGGDKAIDEPWRTAFSYIYKYFGNSPVSSGAGRLFDAVSAILGLCSVATFDSEAPMRLESAISDKTDDIYPFIAEKPVVFSGTLKAIINDLPVQTISMISAKFHNTVAQVILEVASQVRTETSLNKVILSGGVFQNKYLLEKSLYLLTRNRFKVFTNRLVPPNDGGVSLGQLVIASKLIG